MKSPSASDHSEAKNQSPKLTAAMAFGFAAGALLAKKPAAAIAAVATGLLTCFSLGKKSGNECDEEETDEPTKVPQVDPSSVAAISSPADVSIADAPPNPDAVEPLPALIDEEKSATPAPPTDQLLPISLPEIEIMPQPAGQSPPDELSPSAEVARHLHDEWLREIEAAITRK